ncbi:MAG: lipase family protein [Flavobacteriaceae bacterium]|nr:lipase family protein [Flavobacteriaceae bacterium]
MFWSHHFAQVSKLAYSENNIQGFSELGYPGVAFFEDSGAQCYVLWSNHYITIAFRGTEPNEFNDIKADLKAFHHEGYHKGFFEEYMKLHHEIEEKIEELQKIKQRPIYITGHSLGGAMATVCATFYPEAVEMYTYGSPRALSWSKVRTLKVKHKRHVNNNDVVPKVPLAVMGWKHHGELCYLDINGNITKMSWFRRLKDSLHGRLKALKKFVPFDGLLDHSIVEYSKYLSDGR